MRTKPHFYRPRTLVLSRAPKYPRVSMNKGQKMDIFRVIRHPLTTESAMKKMEDNNTLVFLCDPMSNKRQIAKAVSEMHKVKVLKVNTMIRYVVIYVTRVTL